MIFINETCPKCGHNIQNLFATTYQSNSQNECFNCGWNKNREAEDVERQSYSRKTKA